MRCALRLRSEIQEINHVASSTRVRASSRRRSPGGSCEGPGFQGQGSGPRVRVRVRGQGQDQVVSRSNRVDVRSASLNRQGQPERATATGKRQRNAERQLPHAKPTNSEFLAQAYDKEIRATTPATNRERPSQERQHEQHVDSTFSSTSISGLNPEDNEIIDIEILKSRESPNRVGDAGRGQARWWTDRPPR